MESHSVLKLRMRWTACVKNYGKNDPRTTEAERQWAEGKWQAAQAEADRLRAQLDAMAAVEAVA